MMKYKSFIYFRKIFIVFVLVINIIGCIEQKTEESDILKKYVNSINSRRNPDISVGGLIFKAYSLEINRKDGYTYRVSQEEKYVINDMIAPTFDMGDNVSFNNNILIAGNMESGLFVYVIKDNTIVYKFRYMLKE